MSPDIVPLEATQNIELETFITDGSRGSAEVLGWGVAYEKHLSLGQAEGKPYFGSDYDILETSNPERFSPLWIVVAPQV